MKRTTESDWIPQRSELCNTEAKLNCAHINFGELLFQFIHKINSFFLLK